MLAQIDVVSWLASRPLWQQELALRFSENGGISSSQLKEFAQFLESEKGLADAPDLSIRAISKDQLLIPKREDSPTILASIGPVENFDRLAKKQAPIQFATSGVTLIYGGNGTGKSGYCRLIKALCRSLHEVALKGDAYSATQQEPGQVIVRYKVAKNDVTEVTWALGQTPPPELAKITVFDGEAARIYVNSERKVEFLPNDIALVRAVGKAVKALNDEFSTAESVIKKAVGARPPGGFTTGTTAAKLVAAMIFNGELPDEETLRSAAQWSEEKQQALDNAADAVSRSPLELERARRATVGTLNALADEMRSLANDLGLASIERLMTLQSNASSSRELARTSVTKLFGSEPIPNLASDAWRRMLHYARDFALETFIDAESPQLAKGGVCVLCQQELGPAAEDRLFRFASYLEGRAEQDAESARRLFVAEVFKLRELRIRSATEIAAIGQTLQKLGPLGKECSEGMAAYFADVRDRLAVVQDAIDKINYSALANLPPLATPPSVASLVESMLAEADALAEEARRQDGATRRKAVYAELADNKKLSLEVDAVVSRLQALRRLAKITELREATSTTPITAFINRLRKEFLTPALASAFQDEIEALDLADLPVKLLERGEYAESMVQVGLETERDFEPGDVLSEGELKALALASCLAEIKEIGDGHAIVLDDPVSSLDHERLDRTAKRLVVEAKKRQVIIFTHNLFFHHAIASHASRSRVPVRNEYILRRANETGLIDGQGTWLLLTVKKRLPIIRASIDKIQKIYDRRDEVHRIAVRTIYTLLRETWERLIEELVLNGVLGRFKPEIHTKRLWGAEIDAAVRERVFRGMTACSVYSGHDRSQESPPELPDIDSINSDFEDLASFTRDRLARVQVLQQQGKLEEEPPIAQII